MRILFATLGILALYSPAQAASNIPKPKETLERLDDAANFLMRISDANAASVKLCNIKPDRAREITQPLHALIDEKIDLYLALRDGKVPLIPEEAIKTCASTCHCGLYSSVFERKGYDKLQHSDQLISKRTTELAMNQTPADVVKCTNKIHWFCKSALLTFLVHSD